MHISVDRFKVQLTKPCKEKSEHNSHSIFQRGHSKWSIDDQNGFHSKSNLQELEATAVW